MNKRDKPIVLRIIPFLLRRKKMEKYGVEVDKEKVDEQKKKAPGEKTAGTDDPNVNVPKDPDKGTEPFEKKPKED